MTRPLHQPPKPKPTLATQAAECEEVHFFDDQGKPFSFADLVPISEAERRRLGFPFDVPDEFNEAESQWIRERLSPGRQDV
jgi:hypothetical protein